MPQQIDTIAVAPGTWTVDANTSRVRFDVGNMWGLKVKGTFARLEGALTVVPDSADAEFIIDA